MALDLAASNPYSASDYAGKHLIVDLWQCQRLTDIAFIEDAMRRCVQDCGANLLHIHLHHFTPNNGVTGVALLEESHISVHTWPELGYAAFDLFMCGAADVDAALPILKQAFCPRSWHCHHLLRGKNSTALQSKVKS